MTETTEFAGDLPWHAVHANLVTLVQGMAAEGWDVSEIVRAVEKPWCYEDEWRRASISIVPGFPPGGVR